ncbi:hypothetical protein [Ancylobacter moscoviensis]
MNIQPNIERLVDDAYAAQPLTGPQTGTIRKPRKKPAPQLLDSTGNDEAPAIQDDYRAADADLLRLGEEYQRRRGVWLAHRKECDRLEILANEARDAGLDVLVESYPAISDGMRLAALYAARSAIGCERAVVANNEALDAMVQVADQIRAAPAATPAGLLVKARVLMDEALPAYEYLDRSEDERSWGAQCFFGFLADIERLAGGMS